MVVFNLSVPPILSLIQKQGKGHASILKALEPFRLSPLSLLEQMHPPPHRRYCLRLVSTIAGRKYQVAQPRGYNSGLAELLLPAQGSQQSGRPVLTTVPSP